jgi:hypothetical protein
LIQFISSKRGVLDTKGRKYKICGKEDGKRIDGFAIKQIDT